jgi:hypothetical protein
MTRPGQAEGLQKPPHLIKSLLEVMTLKHTKISQILQNYGLKVFPAIHRYETKLIKSVFQGLSGLPQD